MVSCCAHVYTTAASAEGHILTEPPSTRTASRSRIVSRVQDVVQEYTPFRVPTPGSLRSRGDLPFPVVGKRVARGLVVGKRVAPRKVGYGVIDPFLDPHYIHFCTHSAHYMGREATGPEQGVTRQVQKGA